VKNIPRGTGRFQFLQTPNSPDWSSVNNCICCTRVDSRALAADKTLRVSHSSRVRRVTSCVLVKVENALERAGTRALAGLIAKGIVIFVGRSDMAWVGLEGIVTGGCSIFMGGGAI
jgi:hypothetical protein